MLEREVKAAQVPTTRSARPPAAGGGNGPNETGREVEAAERPTLALAGLCAVQQPGGLAGSE